MRRYKTPCASSPNGSRTLNRTVLTRTVPSLRMRATRRRKRACARRRSRWSATFYAEWDESELPLARTRSCSTC